MIILYLRSNALYIAYTPKGLFTPTITVSVYVSVCHCAKVTDRLIDRMGSTSILSIKRSVIIITMLNYETVMAKVCVDKP